MLNGDFGAGKKPSTLSSPLISLLSAAETLIVAQQRTAEIMRDFERNSFCCPIARLVSLNFEQ
jgi:hypothetical protein